MQNAHCKSFNCKNAGIDFINFLLIRSSPGTGIELFGTLLLSKTERLPPPVPDQVLSHGSGHGPLPGLFPESYWRMSLRQESKFSPS